MNIKQIRKIIAFENPSALKETFDFPSPRLSKSPLYPPSLMRLALSSYATQSTSAIPLPFHQGLIS